MINLWRCVSSTIGSRSRLIFGFLCKILKKHHQRLSRRIVSGIQIAIKFCQGLKWELWLSKMICHDEKMVAEAPDCLGDSRHCSGSFTVVIPRKVSQNDSWLHQAWPCSFYSVARAIICLICLSSAACVITHTAFSLTNATSDNRGAKRAISPHFSHVVSLWLRRLHLKARILCSLVIAVKSMKMDLSWNLCPFLFFLSFITRIYYGFILTMLSQLGQPEP